MAFSIDWNTYVINIPRADMLLVQSTPTEVRQLNIIDLRTYLRDTEDNDDGMPQPTTHDYSAPKDIGGVSLAPVVELLYPYTLTFEDGQYAVNITGGNSNLADKVNINQVSIRTANSAGLIDLSTLLSAAYGGEVCVDVVNGQSGTQTPLGTRSTPVNNFADAATIAANESISRIRLLRSATLGADADLQNLQIVGDSPVTVTATIDPAANVTGCGFEDLTITGTLDGMNEFTRCNILNINYVNGFIFQCALNGTITLGGGAQASILDCWSNVAGGGAGQYAAVDMGGSGNSLALRNYSGGLDLMNYSGGGAVSMDMASGRVIVDATVTAGEIYVRGIADVINNSTGTAQVFDLTVNQGLDAMAAEIGEVHQIHGLEQGSPLTVTNTSRTAAGISQTINEDTNTGTTTITRQ